MVLEYVEKNQSKLSGMRSIAFWAMNRWVIPDHECTLGIAEYIQIETVSNKHIEMETLDFKLIF